MVLLAAAEGRAVTTAVALASSCVVVASLYALLLAARYAEGQASFRYSDAYNLTSELCQQLYSCDSELRRARPPNVPAGCSCHDYCRVVGDCCADKTPAFSLSPLPPADSYQCISRNSFAYPVRMVTSCPSSAVDVLVANFCATPTSVDPQPDLLSTPVTDRVSGLTYRNVYCAECWGVPAHRVVTWQWKFACSVSRFNLLDDISIPLRLAEADEDSTTTMPTTTTPEPDTGNITSVSLRLRDLCYLVYTPPLDVASSTHNCTENVTDSCVDPAADEASQRECASGATALVYVFTEAYKNAACAACSSGVPSSFYECLPRSLSRVVEERFEILLSPSSGCCVTVDGSIPESRAWPFPRLCQGQNRCPSDDSTARNAPAAPPLPHIVLPMATLEDYRRSMYTNTTNSCTYTNSLKHYAPSVNVTYVTFANDTLVLVVNESAVLCVPCSVRRCTNFTATNLSLVCTADGQLYHYDYPLFVVEGDVAIACADAKTNSSDAVVDSGVGCPAIPEVVSIVSLCFSEVCLIAFFVVFALVKDQRRFPQEFILNQSIAFFLAFLLFLLRPVASDSHCKALAVTIHYFLLCAFAWTALYAVQITRVLSSVPLRSARNHIRWRLVSYTLGWISPLACVSLGLAADAADLDFEPDYGPPQCFISNPLGSVTLFLAPIGTFLLVDVVAYCYMIVRLIKVARQTAVVRKSHSEKLILCIKLVLCLGLLWISGIVAAFTGSQVAYCIFTLFNTWQGVFTFFIFACKRETLMNLGRRSVFRSTVRTFNSSTATTRSTIVATQSIATDV